MDYPYLYPKTQKEGSDLMYSQEDYQRIQREKEQELAERREQGLLSEVRRLRVLVTDRNDQIRAQKSANETFLKNFEQTLAALIEAIDELRRSV
jgi:hypothetical protein